VSEPRSFEPGGLPDLEVARVAARAHERERYLSALLARGQTRDDLIVLAAFAGEIARIPPLVSEPMMGEIRLQWWREAIENGNPAARSGHPVADLMRDVARRRRLPAGLLIGFIDAHAVGLSDAGLPDDQALRSFLARTEGTLFELALAITGRAPGTDAALVAAAGEAYGLTRMLIEFAALQSQGRTLVPATRLEAAGLSAGALRTGAAGSRLGPVLAGYAAEARLALGQARAASWTLSRAQRVAVLPLALVEPHLRAFESLRDPVRESPALTPLQQAWPLLRAYWSGRL
jgi:phytoene synthase